MAYPAPLASVDLLIDRDFIAAIPQVSVRYFLRSKYTEYKASVHKDLKLMRDKPCDFHVRIRSLHFGPEYPPSLNTVLYVGSQFS